MGSQDKELLFSFLNRTFFKDFKDDNTTDRIKLFNNLEFQINSKCNLDCRYCYYNQHVGNGKKLNPNNIAKNDIIKENANIFLDYLTENKMYPQKIDLFGGEVLNQSVTFDIIESIIKYYSSANQKGLISIPTNMSFLRSDKKTNKILELREKAKNNNVKLGLSASVDGKYMDKENRPVYGAKNQNDFYNDEFYDKLFNFAKTHGCGFHPMIHFNNIEKWKDNFLWFQENFEKYGLSWFNIYLLEVRNDGWTKKSIKHYIDFYKFVLNFIFKKLNKNREEFVFGFVLNGIHNYKNYPRMNMFNNLGTIGRGIGCSIQTTMQMRLGDLTVNPCHRQSYDYLNGFKFIKNNNKIVDIEPLNLSYYLATMSSNRKVWPYCDSCLIKHTCMSGCMGAQFETTGDPFIPIPSVCLLEFGKVKAQIEFLKETNMFEMLLTYMNPDQANTFKQFSKLNDKK